MKKGQKFSNLKYILVKRVCDSCQKCEGQLFRDGKAYCVNCFAHKFGELVVKLEGLNDA